MPGGGHCIRRRAARFDSGRACPYTAAATAFDDTRVAVGPPARNATSREHRMNLVDRVKGILVEPRSEWVKIAAEPATVQSLYTGWIMILASVGPLTLMLWTQSIRIAIASYVLSLISVFVLALIVDALAPTFGGTKDFLASLKPTAYSHTAAWLAGIFVVLGMLGSLLLLIATIYAFYTFFVGAPILNKSSQEKAIPYTLVVILCAIVLRSLVGFAMTGMMTAPLMGPGMGLLTR
jgi:hypothetical protein